MLKIFKFYQRVTAAALACLLGLSGLNVFAKTELDMPAASFILDSTCDEISLTRDGVTMSVVDSGDSVYGNVLKMEATAAGNRRAYQYFINNTTGLDADFVFSYDFYAPSSAAGQGRFYTLLRTLTDGTSTANFRAAVMMDENNRVSVMGTNLTSTPPQDDASAAANYKADTWYSVDMVVSDGSVTYYLNGEQIGVTSYPKDTEKFFQLQIYDITPTVNGQSIYFDNFRAQYDSSDGFYATAVAGDDTIDVAFSQTPAASAELSGISVVNTETGNTVNVVTAVQSGKHILISYDEELSSATEYKVVLPKEMTSIVGKHLYFTDVRFTTSENSVDLLVNDSFDVLTFAPKSGVTGATTSLASEGTNSYLIIENTGSGSTTAQINHSFHANASLGTLDSTTPKVDISFKFKMPKADYAGGFVFGGSKAGYRGIVTVGADKHIYGGAYMNASENVKAEYKTNDWNNVRVVLDYENRLATYYLEAKSFGTHPLTDYATGALNVRVDSQSSATDVHSTMYVDDLKISVTKKSRPVIVETDDKMNKDNLSASSDSISYDAATFAADKSHGNVLKVFNPANSGDNSVIIKPTSQRKTSTSTEISYEFYVPTQEFYGDIYISQNSTNLGNGRRVHCVINADGTVGFSTMNSYTDYDTETEATAKGFTCQGSYNAAKWNSVKIVIDYGVSKAHIYLNGQSIGSLSSGAFVEWRDGVVFRVLSDAANTADKTLYVDNFKVRSIMSSKVAKVRIKDDKGETFGGDPADELSGVADIDVYFTGNVQSADVADLNYALQDREENAISLSIGAFNSDTKTITLTPAETVDLNQTYTLSVGGMDYSTTFNTIVLDGLFVNDYKVVKSDGTEATKGNISAGDSVYAVANIRNYSSVTKSVGIILAQYEDDILKQSNILEVAELAAGDSLAVNQSTEKTVMLIVDDVHSLKLKLFIWDSISGMMPVVEEIEY